MLSVTRLLCGSATPGDSVRYGEVARHPQSIPSAGGVHRRPVVVWNITRRCNLLCIHCYASATDQAAPDELSTDEALEQVKDLADFGVPVVLFSGGEPLVRPDIFELMSSAASQGVKPVLSTNGTLLTEDTVKQLVEAGVNRVGISLDGMESTNDEFRGKVGAFQDALAGIRRCQDAGIRVSARLTMARHNVDELDNLFDLVEQEGVPRFCVYHLAYAGRGRGLLPDDLDADRRRRAVDTIFERTVDIHRRGKELEVLTVDNHADGAYLLLWARDHAPDRVPEIEHLLSRNGGNSSGTGIGCIDERGFVHPDQFWRTRTLGQVRERPFSAIWQDDSIPLLRQLRSRKSLLPKMCTTCQFLSVCNGNLRARAEAYSGDPWGEDPACFLTNDERTNSYMAVGI